uniref:Uncharacterized protein n=1 Tax=Anguilla anguilla TaxID=7936 RepID=A0A0E9SZV0_ANGAN
MERTTWEASSAELAQRCFTMAMPERSGAWRGRRVLVMLPFVKTTKTCGREQ